VRRHVLLAHSLVEKVYPPNIESTGDVHAEEKLDMHRKRVFTILMACALLTATSATGWGADTNVLVDNHPAEALAQPSLGNADPNQPLILELSLELRNTAQLAQLLREQQDPSSPNYHKWLKTGEFDRRFGPRDEDVSAVSNWLRSEGFSVDSTSGGHIEFSGDVAHAQNSFAVRIARFGDGTTYANLEDPTVPPRFAGIIGAITGLDNMVHVTPVGLHRTAPTAPKPLEAELLALNSGPSSASPYTVPVPFAIINGQEAFGPQDMRTFYDETVQTGSDGTGSCIAIVGTSAISAAALNAFNNQFGLPPNNLTQVVVGKSPGETKTTSEIEAELDVEWSHAVAPGATQKLFIGSTGDVLANDISRAIKDNKCNVISISFGYCGTANTEFTKVLDPLFKKAAAQGQSVFVSSGDQGAAGLIEVNRTCEPGTSVGVSEMSADPSVTSVGGTQANATFQNGNDVGYSQESTWNTEGARPGATGGGASAIFAKPAYQTGPGVPDDSKRDVPDVALLASPTAPGVFLGDVVDGPAQITCCTGGTSLSAPLMAGFVDVIDQQVGQRMGNMNPLIYELANQQYGSQAIANGFHDVTMGNNDFESVIGFEAGPAYDQTTGWGSIDFDVFAAAVKANPPPIGPLTFPKTVKFGNRKLGTPPAKAKNIALKNPAKNKASAILSADAALSDTTDFTITASTCKNGTMIQAGKSCSVSVQFNPQTAGKIVGTLTFMDNSSNSPQVVSLTGVGK
jgi:subtilase family serine protease